jgi:hypothetical protein
LQRHGYDCDPVGRIPPTSCCSSTNSRSRTTTARTRDRYIRMRTHMPT